MPAGDVSPATPTFCRLTSPSPFEQGKYSKSFRSSAVVPDSLLQAVRIQVLQAIVSMTLDICRIKYSGLYYTAVGGRSIPSAPMDALVALLGATSRYAPFPFKIAARANVVSRDVDM